MPSPEGFEAREQVPVSKVEKNALLGKAPELKDLLAAIDEDDDEGVENIDGRQL